MSKWEAVVDSFRNLKYLTKLDIVLASVGYLLFVSILVGLYYYHRDDMSDVNLLLSENFSEQYRGLEFVSFSVSCQRNRQYATFKLTPSSEPREYEFKQDKSLCPAQPEKDLNGHSSFTIHKSKVANMPRYHIHTTGEELLDPYTPAKAQYYITLVNLAFAQLEYEKSARFTWEVRSEHGQQ